MDLEEKVCRICHKEKGKYTCPKCGIEFCSSACYKDVNKHLKCSEDFYRRCVQERISSESVQRTDAEKVKRMKDILRRFHSENPPVDPGENFEIHSDQEEEGEEEEEPDSDDDDPLEARLGTVDLDDSEEVWKLLTPEEKAEFQRMVKKTEAKGVEVVAEPWCPGRGKLVQEVDPENDQEFTGE